MNLKIIDLNNHRKTYLKGLNINKIRIKKQK